MRSQNASGSDQVDTLRERLNVLLYEFTDSDDVVKELADLLEPFCQGVAKEAQEKAEYWQQFGELYEVSTLGRVRRNGKILKQSNREGYRILTLSIDNKQKTMLVHRMVALRFIPNPENKPQVNHIDGDKANNMVTNLEWCTPGENEQHSYDVLGKVTWNKNKIEYETINCLNCGKELVMRKWKKAKYCSLSCQALKRHRDNRAAPSDPSEVA